MAQKLTKNVALRVSAWNLYVEALHLLSCFIDPYFLGCQGPPGKAGERGSKIV